ncbi:NADP-dependent oxidoreductase [Inquilinus limosus]|uniref:NADP-dependent oxidoreductase n=1 Tax=Inquilinus limosus TaxID=171674 RepID=UPI000402BD63|nr:NADP-dependent oxidoreductase [Inquilinus limosus]
MATMRSVRIHEFGGPEVLAVEEIATPHPMAGEVLVRVHAAGVNPVDYKVRSGQYPPVGRDRLPVVLGRDIAGEVVESGGGRGDLPAVGDPVYAMLGPDRGGYADYAVVKSEEVAPKPEGLSDAEAAAVPLAALTAWQGLFDHGGLQPGQRVLIHGGAGGVGHFAVQFAKARGAFVATTVSGDDLAFAHELGADQAVDYKADRFEDRVEPVDMVFDLVAGETQDRSWAVLKPGGILVSTLGRPPEEKARAHRARGAGYMVQPNGRQLDEIRRLIEDRQVRPVVGAVLPLKEASAAHERLERHRLRGKLVLEVATDGAPAAGA